MDDNVFNQNDIASKLNQNFVSYKVDAEDFEGVNTALKYNVTAYPTYIFLTPEGEIIHRLEGMIPQESFAQAIDAIISNKKL
jgi:thioredoxin-related protein